MSTLKHMQQLDGLRGIAILGVFLAHFMRIPASNAMFVPWGSFGVRLFFVLSGFLITGILIKARGRVDSGQQTIGFTLRNFYARRVLRLLVVYYAWLVFTRLVFGGGGRFWWDVFYLSNFYDMFFLEGHGNHYWSLAVEEQFYLIWPCLVLMSPKRLWGKLFLSVFILGTFLRIGMAVGEVPYLLVKKIPLTCFDAMAAGAIVALSAYGDSPKHTAFFTSYKAHLGIVGSVMFVVAMGALRSNGAKGVIYTMCLHTSFVLIAVALLVPAIEGYRGLFGSLLSNRALCWVGRISYGCYLFHIIAQVLVRKYLQIHVEGTISDPIVADLLCFLPKVVLTLTMAQLSWSLLEFHVLKLKSHFPMHRSPNVVALSGTSGS